MLKLNSLEDLLLHELRDLYSAEMQIVKALPKLTQAAASPGLAEIFATHLDETERQLDRLDTIFEDLGESTQGVVCRAMEGLLAEADELLAHDGDPAVKDAAMIAAAQRVEHYEIAGYGAARTFAEQLGYSEIAELLQLSLDEEHAADDKLNNLAISEVNIEAGNQ
jgi:ferritin-like metal-binding protein YciE